MWRPSSSRSSGQSSLNLMSRFCWVRIHDLKSTQARQGRFPCSAPCVSEADVGAGAEAAASLRPGPRPRASVTKSSVISERAPPGRKEKRPPREKAADSLGAAILLAHCLPGQEGLPKVGQASAHAAASARPQEPEVRPRAQLTLGPEAGPGDGAERGASAGAMVSAVYEAAAPGEVELGARAEAALEAAARALLVPLRLVVRRGPGVCGPWWDSGLGLPPVEEQRAVEVWRSH